MFALWAGSLPAIGRWPFAAAAIIAVLSSTPLRAVDSDADGVDDAVDNCPLINNPDQADLDADGIGNDCDNCPSTVNAGQLDRDSDFVGDACDNCVQIANTGQQDKDRD